MSTKIGFFHTVAGLAERFDELATEYVTDTNHFHIVDESVLNDALEEGELTPAINQRICAQLTLAEDAGAQLILDTCSSTSPAVDVARDLVTVPILKIDDPMTEKAVELGNDITVLATAESTLAPSTELVRRKAVQSEKDVSVDAELVEGALDARQNGDRERHDQLITEAAHELAPETDILVLAQASMSHLESTLSRQVSVPVLSSPELAIEAVANEIEDA